MSEKNEDSKYLKLLRSDEGFEKVFLFYYTPLKAYALTILFDKEVVSDILQDVFSNLWEKRKKLPADLMLSSYLYKAVYNSCLNYIKHQKANLNFIKQKTDEQEIQLLLLENTSSNNYQPDSIKIQEVITQSIDNLSDQTKRVFLLSRKFGLKNKEIASFLDISIKAVEKHISKALKELREKITKDYPKYL